VVKIASSLDANQSQVNFVQNPNKNFRDFEGQKISVLLNEHSKKKIFFPFQKTKNRSKSLMPKILDVTT